PRALQRPSLVPQASILFVLGFSIYTEFTPLLVGVGGVSALVAWWMGQASARRAAIIIVPMLAVALNPAACLATTTVVKRSSQLGQQIALPFGFEKMLCYVWLDFVQIHEPGSILTGGLKAAFVGVCFALAFLGWAKYARSVLSRRLVPLPALLTLMLLPLAVAVAFPNARYATFKLLLSISPLFVLGLAMFAKSTTGWFGSGSRMLKLRRVAVAAIGLWLIFDTLTYQSNPHRREQKVMTAAWNSPDLRALLDRLGTESPCDVVLILGDGEDSWVPSGALLYHARQHRIRIESPRRLWLEKLETFPTPQLQATGSPPEGSLLVARPELAGSRSGEELVRTNLYVLLRVTKQ
ncbi:MAG: hypothetical protein L0241_28900, partial [Planctomycetia bacterium]|nr:hypothetical protein [Planctomycetia bacterium]